MTGRYAKQESDETKKKRRRDIPSLVSSRTLLYADDALEYEIGAPPSTISLQRSKDHTTQWAACWHGRFSSCKTELLLVGRQLQTSADHQVTISIYSSANTECSSHKHLGVTISSDLNWSAHVTQLIKKASRRCGLLRCMSHHLPPTISSLLYIYHVRPGRIRFVPKSRTRSDGAAGSGVRFGGSAGSV